MPYFTAPEEGAEDPGIYVRHGGMGEDEVVQLRTVLTDGILEAATEQANSRVKGKDAAYKTALILGMVLKETVILDARTGLPVQMTADGIRGLSAQLKNWLLAEINKCDGSIAGLAEVEIKGKTVSFRQAT